MVDFFRFDPGLFFWQLIMLFIAVFLLKKLAWKPILGTIQAKEEEYMKAEKHAYDVRKTAQRLQRTSAQIIQKAEDREEFVLSRAHASEQAIIAQAQQRGDQVVDEMVSEARYAMVQEKAELIDDARKEVAKLVVDSMEQIIRTKMDRERDHAYVEQVLNDVYVSKNRSTVNK